MSLQNLLTQGVETIKNKPTEDKVEPKVEPNTSGGYKPVQGTYEDPYKLGTSGQGVFKVQECIGFTGADVDGKFGPKTQAKLLEYVKVYSRSFTNDDIDDICKMVNPRRDPSIAPITAVGTDYKPERTSPLKMADLAPKTDTTTLAPGPKASVAPVTQPSLTGKDKRIANRINRLQTKQANRV